MRASIKIARRDCFAASAGSRARLGVVEAAAASCCASTDLLSHPLAILRFYAVRFYDADARAHLIRWEPRYSRCGPRRSSSSSPSRGRRVARTEVGGAALADELFRAYLQQILVDGVFHADPHPGNVLLAPDHRLGLIDLGRSATGPCRRKLRTPELPPPPHSPYAESDIPCVGVRRGPSKST